MDPDDKLALVLRATADCEEVILVQAGVAYEGIISSFYAGVLKATVRVCGDPSNTARFMREFRLADVEDIAAADYSDSDRLPLASGGKERSRLAQAAEALHAGLPSGELDNIMNPGAEEMLAHTKDLLQVSEQIARQQQARGEETAADDIIARQLRRVEARLGEYNERGE